jgi:hypothetical protein
MTTVKPTKHECEKVLALVKSKFEPTSDLQLRMEWDWANPGGWPAITWEEGPYEWAFTFLGLIDQIPGLWIEPYSPWAISIYKEVTT